MPSPHGFIAPPPEEDQTRERQNQSPSDPHIPLDTCRAGKSETNLLAKRDRRQSERRWSETIPVGSFQLSHVSNPCRIGFSTRVNWCLLRRINHLDSKVHLRASHFSRTWWHF
jgi:hypothetical protein